MIIYDIDFFRCYPYLIDSYSPSRSVFLRFRYSGCDASKIFKLSYRTQKLFLAKGISLTNSVNFFTRKIYHYHQFHFLSKTPSVVISKCTFAAGSQHVRQSSVYYLWSPQNPASERISNRGIQHSLAQPRFDQTLACSHITSIHKSHTQKSGTHKRPRLPHILPSKSVIFLYGPEKDLKRRLCKQKLETIKAIVSRLRAFDGSSDLLQNMFSPSYHESPFECFHH